MTSASVVVGEGREGRAQGAYERRVRRVGARTERAPAEHRHRFVQRVEAADRLVDEAGRADAGRAVEQQRAGVAGSRRLEHGREPANASSRPTNRGLVNVAGTSAF